MSQHPSPKSSLVSLPKPSNPEVMQRLSAIQVASTNTDPINSDAPKPRSISYAGPSSCTPPRLDRRTSIQFATNSDKPERSSRIKIIESIAEPSVSVPVKGLRHPSPPPPSTYHSRVSFDTFNNSSVTEQEFTLACKHNGYAYGRHQRVFLVAIDQNAYSEHALKWLIEDMVEDGDEVICLRVVESDPKTKEGATSAQMATYKEDTKELLRQIQEKNDVADKKAISIVMEFAVGSVEKTILHMINIYSPAFLTVGTRGKSLGGLQGLLPGSVSKWCMQNSPVPVVVVRHPDKRQKKMDKRKNDPNRKGYAAILDKSASIPESVSTTMRGGKIIEAEAGEAEAVAKALGLSSKLANWKGIGLKKDGSETLVVKEGYIAPNVKSEESEQVEADNEDKEQEGEAGEAEDEFDEDEDDDSEGGSPTGVMYAESGGIETMHNYVGEPTEDLDDDVERLALTDDDEDETTSKGRTEATT